MSLVEGPVAVLDLAPERTSGLGGKLHLPLTQERIALFSPLIRPPRLTGRSPEAIGQIAKENFKKIERCLHQMQKQSWSLIVINDVTLYLHQGQAEKLLRQVALAPTIVLNGYFGRFFGSSAFSRREREEMTKLLLVCDQIIFLPSAENRNGTVKD